MKNRIVLIEWLDSRQATPEWQHKNDAMTSGVCLCRTVGFLLHQNEDEIILAMSLADENSTSEQVAGVMSIPVKSIIKRSRFKSEQRLQE